MSHVATLWIAPGVLLRNDIIVPSPPPFRYCIALMERLPMHWLGADTAPLAPPEIQTAEFALVDATSTGEVAHYELRTMPPPGYRWIVRDGKLYTERT